MKKTKKTYIGIGILFLLILLFGFTQTACLSSFGGTPEGSRLERMKTSPIDVYKRQILRAARIASFCALAPGKEPDNSRILLSMNFAKRCTYSGSVSPEIE